MKQILTILLCMACLFAHAQTDREILLKMADQQTKLMEQQAKFSEQLAVMNAKIELTNAKIDATNARIDALEKNIDKRLDGMDKRLDFMQMLMIIIIPLILTSVLGIIGFILWDRLTVIKPIQEETKKELDKMKDREQKLEDAIKKIIQIEPRFSGVI